MTQHFAASWLQSLEKKLEALSEWTWADEQRGACTTHRNLFREFFNPKFQKTLALVDDQKRIAFLARIESNLYKFEGRTQQFPLGCLCSLLQHGKDSPKTKEKIITWVNFLLAKLHEGLSYEAVKEVVEECLSDQFQRFVPFIEDSLMERLSDGLGVHLPKCDEDMQKKVMEDFSAIPDRIEKIMVVCTKELNSWLVKAPCFPSTPLVLSDTLSKLQHPLLRFFNRIKDATKKESFLVAAALMLQSLRSRFRWMCAIEPNLESMRSDLQEKLFTVEGQGPVMDMWLSSRVKKYNVQTATKAAQLLITDPVKSQELKAKLQPLFPERIEGSPESGWVALDVPSAVADALLNWMIEQDSNFFVPQHTLAAQTILGVLHRFGKSFETDPLRTRARLGGTDLQTGMVPPPPRAQFPPFSSSAAPGGPPVMVPPPPVLPGSNPLLPSPPAAQLVGSIASDHSAANTSSSPPDQVDNLVDLLLQEALEQVSVESRSQVVKIGHGVYRFGEKEVTLHTVNGQLFVYRAGMMVRNCPLKTLLQEEGMVSSQTIPGASSTSVGAVDTSSVAKIASLGAQISSGVTMKTSMAQQVTMPFHRPAEQKSDPVALTSKRVEAASRAMNVAIQFARRSIDFSDEKFLRKILGKGLKYDKQWSSAYSDFCAAKGIIESDHKKHDKEAIASFIERNLASAMNEDWAQKMVHGGNDEEKKDKKDKKAKKKDKKEKKEKKRKAAASDSASSSPERQEGMEAPLPPVMQPPSAPPPAMHMPMDMSMYQGMAFGGMMGHPMGMGGMVGHFGAPGMMSDGGMPMMGMEMMTEDRPRKKPKTEKADKQKKNKR